MINNVGSIVIKNGGQKMRFKYNLMTRTYQNTVNPTIEARIINGKIGIYGGGTHASAYNHLEHDSKQKAQQFFNSQKEKSPYLSWMETRFLQMLEMVATGKMASKISPEEIQSVDINDPKYFAYYRDFGRDEDRYREIGTDVLRGGKLMAIDLMAGMALGFGGTAKGAVQAHLDARYENEKGITYLDIKRGNYLSIQRQAQRHLIAAAMVSDESETDIINSLQDFADKNKVKLILIREGASMEEIIKIRDKYKNNWKDTIIVPIIKQPPCLLISENGKKAGSPYQKGHGDFYDVVQSQLKNVIEAFEIEYVFTNNIDNTGALVSRSTLGYFVEQAQQKKIEAMMEAAEKFEGDKGGVPAIISGKFMILEEAFVPKEWKDRFNGRDIFPYMNTNTFWFTSKALLEKKFSLPLMIAGSIEDKGINWLKIESIMGHGLQSLKWKALVVDRGLRFLPAKFLKDLWIGRSDWMRWVHGKLMPVMRDGEYIPKPLIEVSKKIFGDVAAINKNIFMYGSYDSMKELKTLIIGGEGKHFNSLGDYRTKCGVCYRGDVAVIYEHKEGHSSGTLIIQGASEGDEITLEDSLIFVPAGEVKVIKRSVKNDIDKNINKEDLVNFLANTTRWTEKQKNRLVEKFFPTEAKVPKIEDYLSPDYLIKLSETSRENAIAAMRILNVKGTFAYKAKLDDDKVFIYVDSKSRTGIGREYRSKADNKEVLASTQKSIVIKSGDRILVGVSGDEMAFVGIPVFKGKGVDSLCMFLGKFNEKYPSEEKPKLLKEKLKNVIEILKKKGMKNEDLIASTFCRHSWGFLLENNANEIASQIQKSIKENIPGKQPE